MDNLKRKNQLGDKYLSFKLMKEEYCIEIDSVREIMALPPITPIPQTPDFIRGIINLRGKIIPVVDLDLKFEFGRESYGPRACVVVISFGDKESDILMGLIVDETQEVVCIEKKDLSEIPYINTGIDNEYVSGIAEFNGSIKIILDVQKVLGDEDFSLIRKLDNDPRREEE